MPSLLRKSTSIALVTLATWAGALALRSAPALADSPAEQAKEVVQDAKQKAKETAAQLRAERDKAKHALREAKEEVLEASHEARDKAKQAAIEAKLETKHAVHEAREEAREKAHEAVDAVETQTHRALQGLRAAIGGSDRAERVRHARKAAFEKVARRVKKPSDVPHKVREELRHHARRVARLARIRALAAEKPDPALVERSDALLKRENERHETKMSKLWATERPAANHAAVPGSDPDDEGDPPDEIAEEAEEENL